MLQELIEFQGSEAQEHMPPIRSFRDAMRRLGEPEHHRTSGNSLALLDNLFTASWTDPQPRRSSDQEVFQALDPFGMMSSVPTRAPIPVADFPSLGSSSLRQLIQLDPEVTFEMAVLTGVNCNLIGAGANKHVVDPSQELTDVDKFSRRMGVSKDVADIKQFCRDIIRNAEAVSVTLRHDPEDGSAGIHFTVRTSAGVDTVLEAQDRLHEALGKIPVDHRELFSIGYHFVR